MTGAELGLTDTDSYINENAVAFLVELENDGEKTLALVFKGTDMLSLADWSHNIANPEGHWSLLQPFAAAAVKYAQTNGITNIVATGHSLGGTMAELFLRDFPDRSGLSVRGCTFAAPILFEQNDPRMTHIQLEKDIIPMFGRALPNSPYAGPTTENSVLLQSANTSITAHVTNHCIQTYIDVLEELGKSVNIQSTDVDV